MQYTFEATESFSDGLAAVSRARLWGYINPEGSFVIQPAFDEAEAFREGFAAVKSHGKWRFIDKEGRVAIPFQFDQASHFSEGLAYIDDFYIDRNGRRVLSGWDGQAFMMGLAPVNMGRQEFGYINKKGHLVFSYKITEPNSVQ